MQYKYILIAYKPNSSDYCKGCLMASYSSDHEIITGDDDEDKQRLINRFANLLATELECGEAGYEFTLFCPEEEVDDIESKAKDLSEQIKIEKQISKEKIKQQKQEEQIQQDKEKRFKEFQKLQQEFGS